MTTFTVHAIDPGHLASVRERQRDVAGNRPVRYPDAVGSPLRCCLRRVRPDDDVLLISYAPLEGPSPWREVGPVFVHAEACDGYPSDAGLPPEQRTGARVLRGYRRDGSLDYDAIAVVPEGEDLEKPLRDLLAGHDLREVHVRALAAQCFTYLVRPI